MPEHVSWETLHGELEAIPGHQERQAAARRSREAAEQAYFRSLGDVRRARELAQATVAQRLGISAPSVSQVERQTDLYVSTLRRYVEAMGGTLRIQAVFPDRDVNIDFDDFEHVDRTNPEAQPPRAATN